MERLVVFPVQAIHALPILCLVIGRLPIYFIYLHGNLPSFFRVDYDAPNTIEFISFHSLPESLHKMQNGHYPLARTIPDVIEFQIARVGYPALAGLRPWWAPHGALFIYLETMPTRYCLSTSSNFTSLIFNLLSLQFYILELCSRTIKTISCS